MGWKDLTDTQRTFLQKYLSGSFFDFIVDKTERPENVAVIGAFEDFLAADKIFRKEVAAIPNDIGERLDLERRATDLRNQGESGGFAAAALAMAELGEEATQTAGLLLLEANGVRTSIAGALDIKDMTEEETKQLTALHGEISGLLADPIPRRSDLEQAIGLVQPLLDTRDAIIKAVVKRQARKSFDDAWTANRADLERAAAIDPVPYAKAAVHATLVPAIIEAARVLRVAQDADASDDQTLHEAGRDDLGKWLQGPNALTHEETAKQHLEERKRLLAETLSKANCLEAEIERLCNLPPETVEAEKLQRLMPFQAGQVGKLVAADDLENAQRMLVSLDASVAAMKSEEAEIAKAVLLKTQVLDEYSRIKPRLIEARTIYAVSGTFAEVVKAFAEADRTMNFRLAKREYERALPALDKLVGATAAVLAQKGPFEEEEKRRVEAMGKARQFVALWRSARATPLTTPAALTAWRRGEAIRKQYETIFKAKDWPAAILVFDEGIGLANQLISDFGPCTALVDDEKRARDRFVAVCNHANPIMTGKKVTLAFKQRCADLEATIDEFADVFNDVKDIPHCLLLDDRLEALDKDLDALAEENADAIISRDLVRAEWRKAEAKVREALLIEPATDKILALQRSASTAFDAYCAADEIGAPDCLAKLNAAIAAAEPVLAAKDENAKSVAAAKLAFDRRKKQVRRLAQVARRTAAANAPDLAALESELIAAWNEASQFSKSRRFCEGIEALEAAAAVTAQIANGVLVAQGAMNQRKLEVEALYDATFKKSLGDVLDYEDVTPDMQARHQAVLKLRDELDDAIFVSRYDIALEAFNRLEPLVGDLAAFKAKHDELVLDMNWVHGQLGALGDDINSADALQPVNREIAAAVALFLSTREACASAFDEKRFSESRAACPAFKDAVAAALLLKSQHDLLVVEKKKVDDEYALLILDYNTARDMRPLTPEISRLKAAWTKADDLFDKAYFGFDYATALLRVEPLGEAVQALVAKKTEHDTAALDADRKAGQAETELDSIDPSALKSKTAAEKLALLDNLRSQKQELTPKQRELQRKVYMAMDLDPEFLKEDEKRRERLIDTIRGDTELFAAKDGWATETPSKKIALLTKTLNAECDIYGMPVPVIQTFSTPFGEAGSFARSTGVIRVNTHPEAAFDDFFETIDTIVHENAHNYQVFLVEKLQEGLIQPGDPEYMQALMFAANSERWAYVEKGEDPDCYTKEPLEEHAWKTGGDVKAALKKPPVIA